MVKVLRYVKPSSYKKTAYTNKQSAARNNQKEKHNLKSSDIRVDLTDSVISDEQNPAAEAIFEKIILDSDTTDLENPDINLSDNISLTNWERMPYVVLDVPIKKIQSIESAKKMAKVVHQNWLLAFTCLPYEPLLDALADTYAHRDSGILHSNQLSSFSLSYEDSDSNEISRF